MLLRPDGDGAVVAIGQASHAWLSGQLARAWGNGRFARPEPHEEVCLGAEQHDVGMAEWDRTPARHPETGLPREFFAMDRRTHLALWAAAPGKMLTQSAYAALLVSLHGTGLLERFPPRTAGDAELERLIAEHLGAQRRLQQRLAVELGAADDELLRNQALLAAWDDLSLALCRNQAPHDVHGVPVTGDESTTLALRRGGGDVPAWTLDPWPFAGDVLRVQAEGRRLTGTYGDDAELHAVLRRAPLVRVVLELRPARG
jgi:hypothetical protein